VQPRQADHQPTSAASERVWLTRASGAVDSYTRFVALCARYAAYLGGAGITFLVLVTVVDVSRRAFGMSSINGLLDFTEVALVFVVYFGFAQAEVDQAHIRTSFATGRLPHVARCAVVVVTWTIATLFLLWAVRLTGQAALDSFQHGEARASQSGVPVWPARALVAVGLLGLAAQGLANVLNALLGRIPEAEGVLP
jgi:TRAP-type mannitol/chloroaromatic compound transport system permease small subunit